ncbi:UPF0262 family protein [Lichenifustis flavocetrariae]|uniref:UPF0262 family protein n=1 Tax=Lichenifustis flavocetrariae TaxID=2949735 RepID=A0AA42CIA0_9HYPH|nr:UPF0262 family protein [Lichenifustis flavocetrariae]MCW6508373.1 UPF0262 family protein [Lichenifustis flavocetrariae]
MLHRSTSAPVVADAPRQDCLVSVTLDEASIGHGTPDQAHERRTAIEDLIEVNRFIVPGHAGGPYALTLAIHDAKLAFDIRTPGGDKVVLHLLSLRPFRSILKDYMMVCESYVAAIRTAPPSQIEAIDMGRRGLHDEGAERLAERLRGKIEADFATMRRLFTLLTALHWKG